MTITPKRYACAECGTVTIQHTNHFGQTWSLGRYNICPKCPPYKKLPEYGGQTVWTCLEQQPVALETP